MTKDTQQAKFNRLIEKALSDDAFKAQLFEKPVATFNAEGIEVPAGLKIEVVENSDTVFHLVLPHKTTELSDNELDAVAGGMAGFEHPSAADLYGQISMFTKNKM